MIVWVGIGLATFQQLVGINVVFYYGAVLWQSVGFTESDALLINVHQRRTEHRCGHRGTMLVDRQDRPQTHTVMIGSIGMAITLAVSLPMRS